MTQLFQDAMTIARTYGKPDIFYTMTANPSWPELQEQLFLEAPPAAGANHWRRTQVASDRPDIVACVFELKKNAALKDIQSGVFGRLVALLWTIEFQKRGLPHTTCMLHSPCGTAKPKAPCMVDNRCSKHYPKEFIENTVYGENGYPQYARPDNGRTVRKNGKDFDNRHVIPYHGPSSVK